jgi:DNA-binding response OmpR family regulator
MEKGKILLIEYDKKDADWTSLVLQGEGYSVVLADSAREAFKKAQEQRYNLIILDPVLPDMKSEEVCSSISRKKRYGRAPVIILSVKDEIGDIEECFLKGASDYIIKPARPEHLLAKVREHLKLERSG